MSTETIKGKICKDYLKRYPKMPIKTLASLIYSENDGQFNDHKQAYDVLRYYSGTAGKHNRAMAGDKTVFRPVQKAVGPLDDMPRSFGMGPEFYDLPLCTKEILLLSDIHMPYHDEDALRAAIMKGEVKTKFGTYTMETRNSTKISTDKLAVFIERLKSPLLVL